MSTVTAAALCFAGLCVFGLSGGEAAPSSPDTSRIAFASHRDGNWEIYVSDADGQNQTRLTRRNGHTRFPLWSADRTKIAFAGQIGGGEGWEFWVMNADGSGARRLFAGLVGKSHREWSREGRRIAVTAEIAGNVDVYVVDVASARMTRVTSSPAVDRDPTWSPDGRYIAFSSERDGNREIYVARADGSELRRLTNNARTDASPVWSPDGTRILFVSDRDGTSELYVIGPDGSALERLTTDAHSSRDAPRWSPDGSHIAFQIADKGRYDVGLFRLRDRKQRVLVGTEHQDGSYTWSPNSKELAYISSRAGAETLNVIEIETNRTRQITTSWSLTPDWAR